jgi:putative transposase
MATLDQAVATLAPAVGTVRACRAVGQPRSSWYRRHRQSPLPPPPPRPTPTSQPRALSAAERQQVLEVLHDERFVDLAPASVWATLLDEGVYLCSISTMYRLLRERGETGDRRRHATHPARVKPELLASGPNQCWSWGYHQARRPGQVDLVLPVRDLGLFSRYVVGWMVAAREAAALAERLLADTIRHQGVKAGQLTVHADRGTSMTAKPVAMLLADLGVTRSHSRPQVSNDNPYSESQFKTLKHHPTFPERFGSLQEARGFCQRFFGWYNHEHRHSGIALLTPADVHLGRAPQITLARGVVLNAAFAAHPERFVGKPPQPPRLPEAVGINKPIDPTEAPQQFPG